MKSFLGCEPTEEAINDKFREIDLDHNGELTRDEVTKYLSEYAS